MIQLGQLAEMRTGFPFRGRIDRAERADCLLVQMGDVRANAGVIESVQTHVNLPGEPDKHQLHYGDVLFTGRGTRNEAATFLISDCKVVAAPHLFVLRTDGRVAFPCFLTWFLNLAETQEKIHAIRRGSAVPFIPMSAFARLEVSLPSLEVQNRIVELQKLNFKEEALMDEIRRKRSTFVNRVMAEAVRKSSVKCAQSVNQ
jgi:hypothetical protein